MLIAALDLGATDKAGDGGGLRQLRFSRDGRYALAQDASEVTVLTCEPFQVLFRIPAVNATPAQFSPDSKEVTLVKSITRAGPAVLSIAHGTPQFERWSVAGQRLVASWDLPRLGCGTLAVGPDARTITCVDFEGTLRVLDQPSALTALEIGKFSPPLFFWTGQLAGAAKMAISPDGRFVVAVGLGGLGRGKVVIWDTAERADLKLRGQLGALRNAGVWNMQFAFVGTQRLVMSCGTWQKKYIVAARIASLPDGTASSVTKIPWGPELLGATDPRFLIILHPYYSQFANSYYGSYRVPYPSQGAAAVELGASEMITSQTPALDVLGNKYVAEVRPGVVGLYERGKGLQASVVLHQQ